MSLHDLFQTQSQTTRIGDGRSGPEPSQILEQVISGLIFPPGRRFTRNTLPMDQNVHFWLISVCGLMTSGISLEEVLRPCIP